MSDFSSESIDSSPSKFFKERLAEEKRIQVYFISGTNNTGGTTYVYAVASAALHDKVIAALKSGVIPDFVVIVEMGDGEPSAEVKEKIKTYYGFDHDYHANNDNFIPLDDSASAN